MRRPQGYATIVDPDHPVVERDAITCSHCQQIVFVKPGSATTVYQIFAPATGWTEVPGAFCRVCMAPVCLRCDAVGRCTPWERRMERSEARQRLRAAVGG